jgi:hypothetical protein
MSRATYFRVTTLLTCRVSFGFSQTPLAAPRFLKSEPNHFDFADQPALLDGNDGQRCEFTIVLVLNVPIR